MPDTAVQGGPDVWGKHNVWMGDHTGPASYTTGGETIGAPSSYGGPNKFGMSSIQALMAEAFSYSGNYSVVVQSPIGNGSNKASRILRWYYANASGEPGVVGAEVVLGTSPTNATYTITATAGVGQIQVVVAAGAISSVKVLNPGSYTSAPTFTPPAGLGSGATITALLGNPSGIEVAPSTNLAGETVRLLVVGT